MKSDYVHVQELSPHVCFRHHDSPQFWFFPFCSSWHHLKWSGTSFLPLYFWPGILLDVSLTARTTKMWKNLSSPSRKRKIPAYFNVLRPHMRDRKSKLIIEIKNVLGKYIGQGKFNQGKILRDKKKTKSLVLLQLWTSHGYNLQNSLW